MNLDWNRSIERILVLSAMFCATLCIHLDSAAQQSDNFRTTPNQPVQTRAESEASAVTSKAVWSRLGFTRVPPPAIFPLQYRTINGADNNPNHPTWGRANIPFLRLTTVGYNDGSDSPADRDKPSARLVSNWCSAQDVNAKNLAGYSDMMWQWGQFLDHDIDLTPVVNPLEAYDIAVPSNDPWFDPNHTGTQTIPLDRSAYMVDETLRQQMNLITAYIDASNVYGSDVPRTNELRMFDGTGRLKTSPGGLLPYNVNGLPNAPDSEDASFFLAGDFRANEQVGLTAMHTIWVREHNKWAGLVGFFLPTSDENTRFERSRAAVIAEMQSITYREFMPILLGPNALRGYRGYKSEVDASISNVFATAAYRFGHTMLSASMLRLDEAGNDVPEGPLSLADAFFNPEEIESNGVEEILRGLVSQRAQAVDMYCVDEVRNFLFGPPGSGGLDLASLNIQRGRDHGLPTYNQVRVDFGLPPVTAFWQISQRMDVQRNLRSAYGTVDNIDVWVGGLAETHVPGAIVGPTFHAILKDQFERLRDGDRFWYETYLPESAVNGIQQQTLARIIKRNTSIKGEINNFAFRAVNDAPIFGPQLDH